MNDGDIMILDEVTNSYRMSRLAQSVEHQTLNLRVVGSSPTLGEAFSLHRHLLPLVTSYETHDNYPHNRVHRKRTMRTQVTLVMLRNALNMYNF